MFVLFQLVVCLCPTARTDRYSAIKKFCCREVPVQSQVVNCSTINRENRMIPVVQNIVIQINNKLGGASWTLRIPLVIFSFTTKVRISICEDLKIIDLSITYAFLRNNNQRNLIILLKFLRFFIKDLFC